ncbi:MAG TPA: FMN-binding negative transcriptional regulator [Erythrobacter sp.]|nr:FMN-binding negative transcriptional regulator [Erythrobacter sp.]
MHPNPSFRHGDRTLHEALIEEIGFAMVFAETPDGPRVAHTPLLSTGDGAVQFHLARGNALSRHLPGNRAVIVINGPEAYISPRWYSDPDQVPTWNYVALELEGPVRKMEPEGLLAMLDTLSTRNEARIAQGKPWTMDKMSVAMRDRLLAGIVGFEMEVLAWRDTLKLSQNKKDEERARVIEGLEQQGSRAMAQMMRSLAK